MTEKFTYDHAGKVLVQTHQTNSNPAQRIADNTYDQLGQLKKKNTGGKTIQAALQNVDYAYNIRGWLKTINDVNNIGTEDLFAFKINYNEQEYNPDIRYEDLYNGNISQVIWKTASVDPATNITKEKKTYYYGYDALNRLRVGVMKKYEDLSGWAGYHLNSVTYDKNGNIATLKRGNPISTIDQLTYAYDTGNKLLSVTDAISGFPGEGFQDGNTVDDDYAYDANGNMTTDANKGITNITYNHLNLPTQVFINNPEHIGNISYIYDASGAKLKKIATEGSSLITTEYAGNYIYENGTLQFFNTAEGYVAPDGSGGYDYVYNFLDHLGSVRLSYTDANGDGTVTTSEIIEENSYYPFGLKMKGFNNAVSSLGNSVAKRYKYNGNELNDEMGLEWYDFGARNYNASLGRWFGIDELAEKHFDLSPYTYTANNPVLFVDFDGNDFGVLVNRTNSTITIKATFISNSKNVAALAKGVNSHNNRSGKAVFVVGGVKALKSGGKRAEAFTVKFDLQVQVDDTMNPSGTASGGDEQVRNDQTGTLNSFDTVSEFPRSENQAGAAGNDEITVREDRKNSETTNHEISHTLGNEHTSNGGTLPNQGVNTSISATAETLRGVGIGGNNVNRNANSPIGDGTLLNGSSNQGLENGKVISVARYNRIVRRVERREQRRLQREE